MDRYHGRHTSRNRHLILPLRPPYVDKLCEGVPLTLPVVEGQAPKKLDPVPSQWVWGKD